MINPVVAGWMNYYGRFYRSRLTPLLQRINTYLMRWAGRSTNGCGPTGGFRSGGSGSSIENPNCFTHWRWDPYVRRTSMRRAE